MGNIFYVAALGLQNQVVGYVQATYLEINGRYVADPSSVADPTSLSGVRGGSQLAQYSDTNGSDHISGDQANPNNYLVVPVKFTQSRADDLSKIISDEIISTNDGSGF